MKRLTYNINTILILLFIINILFSNQITHMNGTYDLDGDNFAEFIALEKSITTDLFPSVVRYYEINSDGYQSVIWEFNPPENLEGYFIDSQIGDLDGDGNPDLIIAMNLTRNRENTTPYVFLAAYKWEGESFSQLPTSTLNISKVNRSIRCNNFALIDQNSDGDQELVLSLGSPFRGFTFIDVNDQGQLYLTKKIRPDDLLVGSGLLYVTVLDYDNDGYEDIIAISPEGNTIKAQPFYNIGGVFDSGDLIKKEFKGISKLLPLSLKLTDWDGDGFKDVIVPFQSGDLIALTLTPATLIVEKIPIEPGPITKLDIADIKEDDFEDLLILSTDIDVITMISGKDGRSESVREAMELIPENFQIFSMLPVEKNGKYSGNILVSGWDGIMNSVFMIEYGKKSSEYDDGFLMSSDFIKEQLPNLMPNINSKEFKEPEIYIEVFDDKEPLEQQAEENIVLSTKEYELNNPPRAFEPEISQGNVLREQPKSTPPKKVIRTLESPKIIRPKETYGQRLPKHILPSYVLTLNQPFEYDIIRDTLEKFHSFKWDVAPPKGMFFHYDSKSIKWIPTDNQLDAFPLSYYVRVKTDELVEQVSSNSSENIEYKTVPVLESRDESVWIYVNDPPKFLTRPLGTEFIAGGKFQYEPIVRDRNKDAIIQFYIDEGPPRMEFSDGVLKWESDSLSADIYNIRIIASDGFERDVQEFALSARSGIRILSNAPEIASVGEKYEYDVKVWMQRTSEKAKYKLFYGPSEMKINIDGILEWTPIESDIDTIKYSIVTTHGVASDTQFVNVFVNHPPIVQTSPQSMTKIDVGTLWEFDLNASDPNKKDKLTYIAHSMPDGMRMDKYSGKLQWEPSNQHVDFHSLKIEITDGKLSNYIESEFFVNAPIKVVSIPTMQSTVGDEYQYKIITVDRNKGALLPFKQIVKIEDISNTRIYAINISDDVVIKNIDRYLVDWYNAETIYYKDPKYPADTLVSRLNMKRYVHSVFYEDNRLWAILYNTNGKSVKIKDFLWEFFQGNKGKPPRLVVERHSPIRYSLTEFPEGMEVDEPSGTIIWTPKKNQTDIHKISFIASDGFTRDEQVFELYSNHLPTIISNTPRMALTGELFKYQVRVEDLNKNANLKYTLVKGPHGMQMDKNGKVLWVPKAAQINYNNFEITVTDGYGTDTQSGRIFINTPPTIISTPKPVGLTGHTWRYKITTEDLNSDRVSYRAVRLPKFAKFDRRTATLEWTPRKNQDGANDFILMAIDEHGATAAHDFQVHVFYDPSAKQLVNTGWPLMLTFVGVVFAWGAAQI